MGGAGGGGVGTRVRAPWAAAAGGGGGSMDPPLVLPMRTDVYRRQTERGDRPWGVNPGRDGVSSSSWPRDKGEEQ